MRKAKKKKSLTVKKFPRICYAGYIITMSGYFKTLDKSI